MLFVSVFSILIVTLYLGTSPIWFRHMGHVSPPAETHWSMQ